MQTTVSLNHKRCRVCQHAFFGDQTVHFYPDGETQVSATLIPTEKVEGYDGIMQGGLITALHDSAMLHCLFHMGIQALTASIQTRFYHSVQLNQAITIQAQWQKSKARLHFLDSQLYQANQLCSSAQSKFIQHP